jgi:acetyl esterase/lipase
VDTSGENGALYVPQRFIPIPATISPQAQASLASPLPLQKPDEPDLADKDAWRHYIAERDAAMAASVKNAADKFPAEIIVHTWGGVPVYEIVPGSLSSAGGENAIFFLHGGAFIQGGGIGAAHQAIPFASLSGMRVFSVDYRMPPDHPFPAGLTDSVEAYKKLLERYDADRVVVYGPSAGGGLAGSFVLKARDSGLPLPAACVLSSPELDLTESGDSFETNSGVDRILTRLTKSIALYADGHDLRNPYLSPLFGDLTKGFPPTILTTGTRDLFLSNAVLMHRALRRAGIEADLHVWEARSHGGFFGADAPEDREVWEEEILFIKKHLGGTRPTVS